MAKVAGKEDTQDLLPKSKRRCRSPVKDFKESSTENCSICLSTFDDRSVVVPCFHEFCFTCLLKWADISHNCPLCKQKFRECYHRLRSSRDYETHVFSSLTWKVQQQVRTNRFHPYRNTGSRSLTAVRRRIAQNRDRMRRAIAPAMPNLLNDPDFQREEAKRKRRIIYDKGLYAKHIGMNLFSRYRTMLTPDAFKKCKETQARAVPWIRRELQALLGETDIELIKDFIMIVLEKYEIQSQHAVDLLRQFLMEHTEHFIHELVSFLRSPFNVDAWDRAVQYDGMGQPEISSGSGSGSGSGSNASSSSSHSYRR
ncbi:hypothetical protein BC829DRAFT_488464 [Chytridium lagenaria]|nr:hypothetical protein BC829DRAFT_488464 [Chytridium lagenaria]